MHGPVNKYELNFLYYTSHFSRLPQAVDQTIINSLSQKFSYDSIKIYPVMNGFSTNVVRSHFRICDQSIKNIGKWDCV